MNLGLTVRDNDREDTGEARIIITPTSIVTREGGESVSFSIVLGKRPSVSNINLRLQVLQPDQGMISNYFLTLNRENWNIPQNVVVRSWNDNDRDGDVSYRILINLFPNNDPNYRNIQQVYYVEVTDIDNDLPRVENINEFISVTPQEIITSEDGGSASFSVFLNTAPTQNIEIRYHPLK